MRVPLHILYLLCLVWFITPCLAAEPLKSDELSFPAHDAFATELKSLEKLIQSGKENSDEFSAKLAQVQKQGTKLGYYSFSGLGWSFLRRFQEGDRDPAHLARTVEFASSDWAVLSRAAALYFSVDSRESLAVFARAVRVAAGDPAFIARSLSQLLILMLTSSTLATAVLAVALMILYRDQITGWIGFSFSAEVRGVVAPTILAIVLFGAVMGGIGWVLCICTFLIARAVPRFRALTFLTGVVLLAWPLTVVVAGRLGSYSHLSFDSFLARWNSGTFNASYDSASMREFALTAGSQDSLAASVFAGLAFREGQDGRARELWNHVVVRATDPILIRNAFLNLGLLNFAAGDFKAAQSNLLQAESLGDTSVILYRRLSQVSLALTNTPEHDRYFALAEARGAAEHAALRKLEVDGILRLPAPVPTSVFIRRLLKPVQTTSSIPGALAKENERSVLASFMTQGRPATYCLLGAFMFVTGFRRTRSANRVRQDRDANLTSRILLGILPGGYSVAQGVVLCGWFGFTLFVLMILIGIGEPFSFAPVEELHLPSEYLFGAVALTALVISVFRSYRRFGILARVN